ncbi:arsenate reductase (glutaredoxin) [Sphingomonas sp.]|uniref:arsenate reductase (glutaredoxin) n=1 Tax=Sphingomonas sp. TaxID=28214 RepID=UPI003B007692
MKATIYHNPRCSKSREALRLLEEGRAQVTVVEYLKTPPTIAELRRLYARAGMSAHDGLRRAEPNARHLADADADEPTVLEAMLVNPALIERPLVETDKGVVLARPPERVQEVL